MSTRPRPAGRRPAHVRPRPAKRNEQMHAGMCVHQRELSIQLTFPSIDSGPVGGGRRRALVPRRRDYTYVTILYILHVCILHATPYRPGSFVATHACCARHTALALPLLNVRALSATRTHRTATFLSLSLSIHSKR